MADTVVAQDLIKEINTNNEHDNLKDEDQRRNSSLSMTAGTLARVYIRDRFQVLLEDLIREAHANSILVSVGG